MAVTLNKISRWLYANGIAADVEPNKDSIQFVYKCDSYVTLFIKMYASEDGELFRALVYLLDKTTNKIVKHVDKKHMENIMKHLLYINYQTKLGTWELDKNDYEIRLAVEIPLEDAQMTKKQFDRIYNYLLKYGDSGFRQIQRISVTGKLPEETFETYYETLLKYLEDDSKIDNEEKKLKEEDEVIDSI